MKIKKEKFFKLAEAYKNVEYLANDIIRLSIIELKKEHLLINAFNKFYFDLLLTEIECKICIEKSEEINLAKKIVKSIENE